MFSTIEEQKHEGSCDTKDVEKEMLDEPGGAHEKVRSTLARILLTCIPRLLHHLILRRLLTEVSTEQKLSKESQRFNYVVYVEYTRKDISDGFEEHLYNLLAQISNLRHAHGESYGAIEASYRKDKSK